MCGEVRFGWSTEEDTPMVAAAVILTNETTSEDQWVTDFLATRDEAAFERLVIRYGPMVLRVCRDILGDRADAEDAFQATFLVLFRQAGSIRNPGAIGRWLYEVAGRVARRARGVDSKRRMQERRALTMEAVTSPDDEVWGREWRPILHEEVGRLPWKLRDAIVLCYLEGLTVEAAACRLNCPPATLKSRLGKGRELLRSRLARRGLAATAVLLLLLWFEDAGRAVAAVPGPLVRGTVSGALGDPAAVSSRVATLARDEEPSPVGGLRLWTVLALLLATLGGVRWSMATGTAANTAGPALAVSRFASRALVVAPRWVSGRGDLPEVTPKHCEPVE